MTKYVNSFSSAARMDFPIEYILLYTNDVETNWISKVMNATLTNVSLYCTASKRTFPIPQWHRTNADPLLSSFVGNISWLNTYCPQTVTAMTTFFYLWGRDFSPHLLRSAVAPTPLQTTPAISRPQQCPYPPSLWPPHSGQSRPLSTWDDTPCHTHTSQCGDACGTCIPVSETGIMVNLI